MSWYAAAVVLAGAATSATSQRKAGLESARNRRRSARESLLTAKYNIAQKKIESKKQQWDALDAGGSVIQKLAIQGKKAMGSALVASGGSGAVADSGSTRQAMDGIAREALMAQTEVVLATRKHIQAIARNTDNSNISEWRNAKLNQTQQNRIANNEMQIAENNFRAGLMNAGTKAYSTGSTVAGTGNVKKWGA